VSSDPRETTNLAAREPERRRVLEARLNDWHASTAGARGAEDPETVARLRSLGYVAGGIAKKRSYTEDDDPKRLIDVDAAIHRGIELYERGRPVEAIETYRQILARRPDLAVAISHLAFLYWSQGDAHAAIDTLQRALSAGVVQASIASQLGVYLAETGSAKTALPLLQAAAADPSDLDAQNALGIAYGHLNEPARALDSFRTILRIDPQNAAAYQNIASIEVRRGNLAAARAALERALAIDPRSARAYTGLGAVQLREGQRSAAIDSWRRAVELDPADYDALFNLASELVNDGQLTAARPYLEQFVRSAPAAQYARDIRRFEALLAGR
jgi:Tfp pilus assembly protein PilF